MEITQIAFFIAVMFFVLALILALAWIARRYMGGGGAARTKGGSPLRRRERRLAMVEAASISPRHKLVLVRRDNVEHLLLLGGGNDLVVESRIPTGTVGSGIGLRDREPQFTGTGTGSVVPGSPEPGPELSTATAPTFPPTTYGAATAGNYEPSLYRRDGDDEVSFRDETPELSQANPEPDYFASARDEPSTEDRPAYLGQDEQTDPPPATSTYEKYRPSYGSALSRTADHEPDTEEEDRGGPAEVDDDDHKQARVLSRFLRKDTNE